MTKQERETLERLTDFDYDWYKENVLDKKAEEEVTEEKVDEPAGDYENIPSHHLAAIERGLADAAVGRMIPMDEALNSIKKKFGF
jgi:predicted transcriptional regulator